MLLIASLSLVTAFAYRWIWLGRVTGIEISLTRFNVLKTLHIYPLNDCLLLLIALICWNYKVPATAVTNDRLAKTYKSAVLVAVAQ